MHHCPCDKAEAVYMKGTVTINLASDLTSCGAYPEEQGCGPPGPPQSCTLWHPRVPQRRGGDTLRHDKRQRTSEQVNGTKRDRKTEQDIGATRQKEAREARGDTVTSKAPAAHQPSRTLAQPRSGNFFTYFI